jgi:thiamine kinase-like enzyme
VSAVVTSPDEITPDRLTTILRRVGLLGMGHAETVTVGPNPAFNSSVCHLRVTYSRGSSVHAPQALVLKRNLPEDWAREAGKSEVEFYTEVGLLRNELPMIVPCFDAAYDQATGDSHLLLLDVSASHESLTTRHDLIALRGVPATKRLEAAVDAVARFHSYWWQHPSLVDGTREAPDWYGTPEQVEKQVECRRREWDIFLAGPGADLPTDIQRLYRRALSSLPEVWDRGLGHRVTSGNNLTLVHGDCYLSQFLCPRNSIGTTYLVDWQSAYADLPSIDLTYLFAMFWTPRQRHEHDRERFLLERYAAGLEGGGVSGYDWESLQSDYRLALIYMIFLPVWDAVNGSAKSYWWAKMQCLTSTYRDWACEELLA